MNKPKVSVIVPVYNTEAYVEQTLRSLTGQTLREIEIIAIDDGSTDDSRTVLERLAAEDPRIRIVTQPNQGLSVTRNRGIELATGEFIHFMDSDDLLEADAYERCYERCSHEDLDFVFFDADSFGEEAAQAAWFDYHRVAVVGEGVHSSSEVFERLLAAKRYRASACLSFIRTNFLRHEQLGFYPGILHEDELFTPQLYLGAGRCAGIARDFFHRRVHAASIMGAGFTVRSLDGYTTVLDQLSDYAHRHDAATGRRIGLLFDSLIPAVARRAAALQQGALRRRFARLLWNRYRSHINCKTLLILLFKAPLKKVIGR